MMRFLPAALLLLLLWQCTSQQAPNGIPLSYNLCLQADGYDIAIDTTRQRQYMEQFLLDSTRHFFSKIIVNNNNADTIYVSTITQTALREGALLLQNRSEQTLLMVPSNAHGLAYHSSLVRQSGRFVVRHLVADKGTAGVLTLLDLPARDSLTATEAFQQATIIKLLKKCI